MGLISNIKQQTFTVSTTPPGGRKGRGLRVKDIEKGKRIKEGGKGGINRGVNVRFKFKIQ
jgi:hypothetical protein